jgi:hypothetical protein
VRLNHKYSIAPSLLALLAVAATATACSSGGSAPSAADPAGISATQHAGSPASIASMVGAGSLPGQVTESLPAFPTFYDAHKDLVVVTDAYPRTAAGMFHANFAPSMSVVQAASQPAWYIVQGRSAAGQLAVLGSEPGESDYSPMWQTVLVRWKPGVSVKVLTSDNMILALAKKGELTARRTAMVVNASVVSAP